MLDIVLTHGCKNKIYFIYFEGEAIIGECKTKVGNDKKNV